MNKVFISYSHKDEEWKDRLVSHLGVLQEQGLLEIWDDRQISGGDDWEPAIAEALKSCHVAVLLITANFLTSKFILGTEVPTLLLRRQNEGVRVIIPLIVKPCAWQMVDWLRCIRARPKDGRPLSGGNDHQIDTDLANLANEIAELLRRASTTASATATATFQPLPPDKIQTAKLPTTSTLFGRGPAELLHFSAFAPPIVKPQSRFVLYIWTFMETQRDTMLVLASQSNTFRQIGTKGPIRAQRGTELTICVDLPDFRIEETIDKIIWEGEISSASFAVSVPKDIEPGKHVCKAKILCGGIQLARLFFEIEVGLEQENSKALKTEEQRIRTVFASYASEDRLEVLRWARGAQTVGVDVFLDVLSLREGRYWEKELWKHIPSRDLFCLFWSEPASKSPWVEKEWKCALVARGLDYIHPVPLVDPRKVPPPKELSAKHFNDLTRIVIEYEQAFRTNSASS